MDKVKAVQQQLPGRIKEVFTFGDAPGATPFASLLSNDGKYPRPHIDPLTTVAVIPYSSGTTGLAKGVELTHYNLVANVLQLESADVNNYNNEVMAVFLPFFHIYGMVVPMGMGLHKGNTLVVMPKFDLVAFLQIVQDYKVTLSHAVPPVILALAKEPIVSKYDISSIRVLLCAAAPLGPESELEVRQKLKTVNVRQGYGMTEMSPTITTVVLKPGERQKPGSAGILVPNIIAKIVDPATGKECGVGERGELWVDGPNKMKGYLRNPSATDATIDKDGFLHTGDICYIDEDGDIFIVDRLKELIKYKGFQVPPAELEELLLTHPHIADAAVVGKPDEEAGELPTAFVVLKKGKEISLKEIAAFVEAKVAPHKKLRGGIWLVQEIPKSASGKILRRILRAKL
jgi:acyl-CoA synthetase (AMP-forming)/AMP-acid ligase II